MKKAFYSLVVLGALLLARPVAAAVDWFDPAYLEANTQDYGTGFINVPTAGMIPHGWLSAALHRYQAKINYGLWNRLEAGLSADIEGYTDLRNIGQQTLAYVRLRLLQQEKLGINLSVGLDGLGWEDLGLKNAGFVPDKEFEFKDRAYVVAGRTLPFLPSMVITAGWAVAMGHPGIEAENWVFANVSQIVVPGLMAMLERDQHGWNGGARFLLSTEIKLDFVIFQAQTIRSAEPFSNVLERNIRFGISYTEKWPRS